MIKLKSILLEGNRSIPLTIERLGEYSKELLPFKSEVIKTVENMKYVYRGWRQGYDPFLYINPAEHVRVSRNTDNFYTLLVDNMNEWKDYPKRSKSIICSTGISYAKTYGRLYIVLPLIYPGKIAICPTGDFWESFQRTGISTMDMFNNSIRRLAEITYSMTELSPEESELSRLIAYGANSALTYNAIVDFFNIVDIHRNLYENRPLNGIVDLFKTCIRNDRPIFDNLKLELSPQKNQFELMNYYGNNTDFPNNKEAWLDERCLLISSEEISDTFMPLFRNLK